jgi:heme exporter protein D
MNWNNLSEFISMGGYGFYVWGSLLTVLGFVVIEVLGLHLRKRAITQLISRSKNPSQRQHFQSEH